MRKLFSFLFLGNGFCQIILHDAEYDLSAIQLVLAVLWVGMVLPGLNETNPRKPGAGGEVRV